MKRNYSIARFIVAGLFAAVVVVVGTHACGQESTNSFSYLGGLSPVEAVVVSSVSPGRVVDLDLKLGQQVTQGQQLARLNWQQFEAERAAAMAEVKIADAEVKNDVDLRYAETLQRVNEKVYRKSLEANQRFEKTISATEIDRLRLETERAKLSAEQAVVEQDQRALTVALKKNMLEVASIRLRQRRLTTPISGTVVELMLQVGEFVNAGQPIARVVNLGRLKVSSQVSIKDLMPNDVATDAVFLVEQDGETREFAARVTFASPEINWTRKSFLVEAEINNEDRKLYAGQFGKLVLKKK